MISSPEALGISYTHINGETDNRQREALKSQGLGFLLISLDTSGL